MTITTWGPKEEFKSNFQMFSFLIPDFVKMQINTLEVLYQNNNDFIDKYLTDEGFGKIEKIKELYNNKISEIELKKKIQTIGDYHWLSMETVEILSNYMIVASFSVYEKAFKELLNKTGKITQLELSKCFKLKEVKKLLEEKFTIDYLLLTDYHKVEELCCLNNDIKHNGLVGRDLVLANSKWTLDQPITNTYDDFIRLKNGPSNLLEDLANKIEPCL